MIIRKRAAGEAGNGPADGKSRGQRADLAVGEMQRGRDERREVAHGVAVEEHEAEHQRQNADHPDFIGSLRCH
jgi:hypothetical protein